MTPPPTSLDESGADKIRLVIADDHDLYRRGLRAVIEFEDGIEIVAEGRNGQEAIDAALAHAPDVVLLDVRMPVVSGIDACREIKEAVPSCRIIILTMSDDEDDLFEAIKAGASGYLLKEVPSDEVAAAVQAVHAGQSIVPPKMAAHLLAEFGRLSRQAENHVTTAPHLTERELEVLRFVARGRANREIAKELFISENTVKNHIRNILEKLQLHSRMEAAAYAVQRRLIDSIE